MENQEERELGKRFGVSSSTLDKAKHLRDKIFPQAGVSLYIHRQQAYAVTAQQIFVWIRSLQELTEMSDTQVLQTLDQSLRVHHHQKHSLRELRIQARFFSQAELAHFINERFAASREKSIISPRTIWRAENGYPIAEKTALVIIAALQARGVETVVDHIHWVIGHQGKRGGSGEGSNTAPRQEHDPLPKKGLGAVSQGFSSQ